MKKQLLLSFAIAVLAGTTLGCSQNKNANQPTTQEVKKELSNEEIVKTALNNFSKEKNLDFYIQSSEVPGPHIIANTNLTDEEIDFAKKLFSRYSKVKGNEKVILNNSGNLEEVDVLDLKKLDEEIKKYQQF